MHSLDELVLRIQQVHDLVGVDLLGGSEDDDLEHLRHSLEKLAEVRSRSHKDLLK